MRTQPSHTAVRKALSEALKPLRTAIYYAAPSGHDYDPRKLPTAEVLGITFTVSRLYNSRTAAGFAWHTRYEGSVPCEPFPCRQIVASGDMEWCASAVRSHVLASATSPASVEAVAKFADAVRGAQS